MVLGRTLHHSHSTALETWIVNILPQQTVIIVTVNSGLPPPDITKVHNNPKGGFQKSFTSRYYQGQQQPQGWRQRSQLGSSIPLWHKQDINLSILHSSTANDTKICPSLCVSFLGNGQHTAYPRIGHISRNGH